MQVLTLKIKDEQSYNEENEVIKIETDSEPEIISVRVSSLLPFVKRFISS